MAKTAYEKALEKQQRENQKIAAQEARRQSAVNPSLVECALWTPHRKKFSPHS